MKNCRNRKVNYVVFLIVFLVALTINVENIFGINKNKLVVDDIYNDIRNSPLIYNVEESVVSYTTKDGMNIVCTLAVPDINKKCPLVVTLAGFLGTRDEEPIPGTDDTVFGRFSRVLAGHGIASLRVDYRGYGDSDGEFSRDCNFSTQVSDILEALDYITGQLQHRVDTKSIGILGFSQGGLVGSVTASSDQRVDSIVLWSPVANPLHTYGGLLTDTGIKQGLTLERSDNITLGLHLDDQYIGWDITLGATFFKDLFETDPVAAISEFQGPMMVITGSQDNVVWPQPAQGQLYLKYHKGKEKLVLLDADHEFNYWDGPEPEQLNDAIYWSVAWFLSTLK